MCVGEVTFWKNNELEKLFGSEKKNPFLPINLTK